MHRDVAPYIAKSSKNFIKASAISFLSSQTLTECCSKKRSNTVVFGMFCRYQIQSVYLPRDCEIVKEIISFIIITVHRQFHIVPKPLGFIPWGFAYSAHFMGIQPFIKPIKDQLIGRKSLWGHQSHTVDLFIFANSERKANSVINTDFHLNSKIFFLLLNVFFFSSVKFIFCYYLTVIQALIVISWILNVEPPFILPPLHSF